jgi:hypothetical protein
MLLFRFEKPFSEAKRERTSVSWQHHVKMDNREKEMAEREKDHEYVSRYGKRIVSSPSTTREVAD